MKVKVININLDENSLWRERFEIYRHDIILANPKDDKWRNYTVERFNIDQQLGTFLMIDEEEDRIAAFVSVFRPKHWPIQVARIGNRTWIDFDYRASTISGKDKAGTSNRTGNRWGITYAYDVQLNCCRENGVEVAIMSRENRPGTVNTMRSSWMGLIKVHPEWKYDDNRYFLSCIDRENYSCWQKMVWIELNKGSERYLLNDISSISSIEYNEKFRVGV